MKNNDLVSIKMWTFIIPTFVTVARFAYLSFFNWTQHICTILNISCRNYTDQTCYIITNTSRPTNYWIDRQTDLLAIFGSIIPLSNEYRYPDKLTYWQGDFINSLPNFLSGSIIMLSNEYRYPMKRWLECAPLISWRTRERRCRPSPHPLPTWARTPPGRCSEA